jgi:hypothetical protein
MLVDNGWIVKGSHLTTFTVMIVILLFFTSIPAVVADFADAD